MSVEASALSRSKLEQKDRSELSAIVEAMGGKAGSRAKKADLVEMVLQLAGIADGGADSNGRAPAKREDTKDTKDAAPTPAPAAPTPATAPTPDEEPPAEWEVSLGDDGGSTDEARGSGGATDATSDTPREGRGDQSRHDQPRQGQQQNRGNNQGGNNQGGGNQGGNQGGGNQGGDGEPGNRRRRRRGRDRDRGQGPRVPTARAAGPSPSSSASRSTSKASSISATRATASSA